MSDDLNVECQQIAQDEEPDQDEFCTKELEELAENQNQIELKENQVETEESDVTAMTQVESYENDEIILEQFNAIQDSENDFIEMSETIKSVDVSEKCEVIADSKNDDLIDHVISNIGQFEYNDQNTDVHDDSQIEVTDVDEDITLTAADVEIVEKEQLKEVGSLKERYMKGHSENEKTANTNTITSSISRFGSPAKQEKGMFKVVQTEKCSACHKTVYAMEKLEMNGTVYHKNCFKCSHCSAQLTAKTFSMNEGVIYCINHFKQLFARKGNYDEGFGRQSYQKKWTGDQKKDGATV